ncbi:MAG TPA: branched-chain amino acid ABC transporter permease [Frankiaceae bacterium]|jgi:branched-chain amino acid transport system permease protein|nr:branched-chain amino acid ABC transporter permease [Frankiaceae bacterium]
MTAVAPAEAPDAPARAERFSPSLPGWAARALVLLPVAWFVLAWLPGDPDRAGRATDWVVFALVGISLNILIGYTGQLSLGHQGFVGAGAFAAAYMLTVREVPFVAAILVAVLVGAVFALLLGFAALRITGLYLSLITLVFGITLQESLFQQPDLTNGGAGQPAFRPEALIEPSRYFYFGLAILAVVVYVDWRLTQTKTGRALFALRENERVAAAFGINVTAYKLLAFVMSGAIAGLAGALFAFRSEQVTGEDYDFFLALTFVLMVVVGGLNSRFGVLVGAMLFSPLGLDYLIERNDWLHDLLVHGIWVIPGFGDDRIQFAPRLIGAFLLLLTLLQFPGGIAQQLKPVTRWVAGGRFSLRHDSESGPGAVEGSSVRA